MFFILVLLGLIWVIGKVANYFTPPSPVVSMDLEIEEQEISLDLADIDTIKEPFSTSAAVLKLQGYKIIYEDNIEEKVAPASLTKLLTSCVALKYLDPDTILTVGNEIRMVQLNSSLCSIGEGMRLKLYDLISGMLMVSGNDAAYTVAVSTARALKPEEEMTNKEAVDYFCDLMNEYAKSIGMENSLFQSPDGYDSSKQYTTVKDLILLAKAALEDSTVCEIVSTPVRDVVFESGEKIRWKNSNCLLDQNSAYYNPYAIGMKTGTTVKAGSNLISAFDINGEKYIAVVVGCRNDDDRYSLTQHLIDELT